MRAVLLAVFAHERVVGGVSGHGGSVFFVRTAGAAAAAAECFSRKGNGWRPFFVARAAGRVSIPGERLDIEKFRNDIADSVASQKGSKCARVVEFN